MKHVTPTDNDYFTNAAGQKVSARGLLIGTTGDISIRMASGVIKTIPSGVLATGIIHPMEFVEIRYTGTSATNIYAFFDQKVM